MSTRKIAPLARDAMAYVLAGGRGSRLMELTDKRAKPAVYFAGKTRIIDFALSNALNSGIRRMGVATQYKAHSLIRHLQRGWNFLRDERNESFDILPASQRVSEDLWYMGTATLRAPMLRPLTSLPTANWAHEDCEDISMAVPAQVKKAAADMHRRRPTRSATLPAIKEPNRAPTLMRPTMVPWRAAEKEYEPSDWSSPKREA